MSADNGIYILQSKDGFRVIHAQCIENLWWWEKENTNPKQWERRNELNPKELINYFGNSKVFRTEKEVFKEAKKLYKEIEYNYYIVEYGICFVRGWEDKEFPK